MTSALVVRSSGALIGTRALGALLLCGLLLSPSIILAQGSDWALRLYGSGVAPGQQDRILFPVDDNVAGAASTPIDVGASFTLEIWIKGLLANNQSANGGGDSETFDYSWINGNILLDRDVWCGTERSFGVSVAGGLVRFGISTGDANDGSAVVTIEGSVNVLDGAWHHLALVRDTNNGTLAIIVDGLLDFNSSLGLSSTDLSYPDGGVPVTGVCETGQLTPYGWYLVVGAEKHDADASFPSFNGFVDELRIWNIARTVAEISASRANIIAAGTSGLVGSYRFEEGTGTVVADTSGSGSPDGDLRAGVAGNGEWVSAAVDAMNTAPLGHALFASGFE